MRKQEFDTILKLDRFPSTQELAQMTIDQLESLVRAGTKELEEMQHIIDAYDKELSNLK